MKRTSKGEKYIKEKEMGKTLSAILSVITFRVQITTFILLE